MFAGSHLLTVDDKGRLAIPARLRARLLEKFGPQLYLTRSYLPCIEIYPVAVFNDIVAQLEQMTDRKLADRAMRAFIGHAEETEVDKQGRILLPQLLRKLARLDSAAVAVGQNRRIEIWSEDVWTQFNSGSGDDGLVDAFAGVKR